MAISYYSSQASIYPRLLKGRLLQLPASETYHVLKIPIRAFVCGLWLEVLEAFNGTAPTTCTVGFIGNKETADPDAFMDAATAVLTSEKTISAASDSQPASEGKHFVNGSGVITVSVTAGNSTEGKFRIWAEYYPVY